MLLKLIASASLMAFCAGYNCGPSGSDPCDADRVGCEEVASFEYLQQCDLTGALDVELGHGEDSYKPVSPTELPIVHYGLQGGQHTYLGFRVTNADLQRYDTLRVTMWMAQGAECAAGLPDNEIPADCDRDLGIRQVVLGGPSPLSTDASDVVQEHGLLLFLSRPRLEVNTVVTVEVEDPCGRLGSASHAYVYVEE